jgi:hypothetical protein
MRTALLIRYRSHPCRLATSSLRERFVYRSKEIIGEQNPSRYLARARSDMPLDLNLLSTEVVTPIQLANGSYEDPISLLTQYHT